MPAGERLSVAVTGTGGRLSSAIVRLLAEGPEAPDVLLWDRAVYDLDDPASAERLFARRRPDLVIHCAAWTDVDGCARSPELAMRRNGAATGELAAACASHAAGLVVLSTNEVFDGGRQDGRGYRPDDEPNPINAYGASKLAGEEAARAAFERVGAVLERSGMSSAGGGAAEGGMAAAGGDGDAAASWRSGRPRLLIVRTSWLFGPGAADFPTKILAAARSAVAAGEPLRLVDDEWGSPTSVGDLASAVVGLVRSDRSGIWHVVNAGITTRAAWARAILDASGISVDTVDVPAASWVRPSRPPRWGVLEPSALPGGPLRPWQEALAEYLPILVEASR